MLEQLRENLRTQDNACTAHPIYLVQKRVRDYGYDPDYDGPIAWVFTDDWIVLSDEESAPLEQEYQDSRIVPEEYTRTAYQDRWEFVQPFFTEAEARRYIGGPDTKDVRVYVDSGYRNREWKFVRGLLRGDDDER